MSSSGLQDLNDEGKLTAGSLSISEGEEDLRSYHGQQDIDASRLELIKSVTHSVDANANDNVLTRLSTLSRRLSHMTAKEAAEMQIDKDDFELQTVLGYLRRKELEQGLVDRHTGVELENVSVLGIDDSTSIVPTVGEVFGAPFLKPKRLIFGDSFKIPKKKGDAKYRKILSNININVNAGEMCLVLGRPGAGCSSLLRTIAGETDQFVRVDGDISYNNVPLKEMLRDFKKDIVYNPELDVHFPHLTVDQTLKFAIKCRTPAIRVDQYSRSKYVEVLRDLWTTVFGLTHTLHTKVGNDFVRGVSGGERKRVSLSEAMLTQASVYCWDNATRGLDASTALEYAEAIRTSTNLMNTASFVTIYQAGERIYEAFDKVTILYQGHQIYFGPTIKAKQYFIDMGFHCPPRQATAEFLTAITDPIGRFPRQGYENKVPNTALEFEDYWLKSTEFQELKEELARKHESVSSLETKELFHTRKGQERMKYLPKKSRYTVNFYEQMKLCTIRGAQNIVGDKSYQLTMFMSSVIQSLIIGSLYYNTPDSTSGAFSRGGIVFFSILFFSLMSLAEVSASFQERPILLKQKGYSFYHPAANVLASTLTQLPLKCAGIIIFSVVVYFLSNLKVDAGAFFTYVLFINLTAQTICALFQMVAAFVPTLAAANALSGVMMMSCVLYASYMIQRPSMVPWFKWFSYMDPILYGFELLITTEFHGRKMSCENLVPSGAGYENISSKNQVCGFTASQGQTIVDGDEYLRIAYTYSFSHVWRNFGIVILFWISFLALNCWASDNIKQLNGGGDHLAFIRGAHLPDFVIGPEDRDGSSSPDDVEKGPSELSTVEQDIDNNRKQPARVDTILGSSEIFMWQHVDYVIPYEGKERKLLDDVQGYIKPGKITALMGESGAGKTTLLNVLSQRVDMGVITGDMLVNGKPITSSFKRRTGYVQQQDVHIAELTVRESLRFAARLRRPASIPDEEKMEYVEKVMDILQMQDYGDSIAGEPGTGLNVEQRKKLSIATEMVAKPELLLFLDEPTSGLDSQSAWAIVKILRDLSEAGQAILCTIHQPSATLFEAFDRVLLLKKGGQTVYFGDIGENSKAILDYFESNGARKCLPSENPAEYILELIGAGATATVEENWFDIWKSSDQYRDTTTEIETLAHDTSSEPERGVSKESLSTYAMPYGYQLKLVLTRTFTQFYRDLSYIMAKFMLMLIAGLIIGFSFFNVKHTVVGMQNSMFAMFFSMILSAPLSNQIQGRAIASRKLYEVRESKSNTFHWSTLLLSQFLVEVPYSVVFSTVFYIAWYFPIQLDNEASRLGAYWFFYCILFQLYYISFALLLVYIAADLPSANVLFGFLFNFIISFCGVVQPVRLMPGFWTFMYKVSPMTYFVQSFLSTILHDREVHCAKKELSFVNPPDGQTCGTYLEKFLSNNSGYVSNPEATSECGYCPYSKADEYLATVGVKFSYRWRNVGFIFAYILFNLCAMLLSYYYLRVKKVSFKAPSFMKKRK